MKWGNPVQLHMELSLTQVPLPLLRSSRPRSSFPHLTSRLQPMHDNRILCLCKLAIFKDQNAREPI